MPAKKSAKRTTSMGAKVSAKRGAKFSAKKGAAKFSAKKGAKVAFKKGAHATARKGAAKAKVVWKGAKHGVASRKECPFECEECGARCSYSGELHDTHLCKKHQ